MTKPHLSFVIPVFNEEDNVQALHQEILEVCQELNQPYEIIYVDDGSTDATLERLKELKNLTIVRLRKNSGQTTALDIGFKLAQGEIIVTLDGDGQNDPHDVPQMLKKLNQGYDVICGWRYPRRDPLSKRLISAGANFLRKIFINDHIHDSGCTLKVFRADCLKDLELYGQMHRFIPGLLMIKGFKVGEIKVNHRPRVHGESKYHWDRIIKGMVDMIGVWFWRKYADRPLHLFGGGGLLAAALGFLGTFYFIVKYLFFKESLNHFWFLIFLFLIIFGLQLFITGLLADISTKIYLRQGQEKLRLVKEVIKK